MPNPTRNFRILLAVLALAGLADSIYLAWIKLTDTAATCSAGFGDCASVNTSAYSEIFGIPIALLGAGAYLVLLALLFLESARPGWSNALQLAQFGVVLTGVLYSAYLTYLEIWVIRAICPFCMLSAVLLTVMLVIAIVRLVRSPSENLVGG